MNKSIVPVNQIATRSSTCYEFSNPNGAEVVEIEDDPVKTMERQMENLKLDHLFNENDVPQIFQNLIDEKMNSLKKIELDIYYEFCLMYFDDIEIWMETRGNDWLIRYENIEEKITSTDPDKFIIGLLWFVLKNPNIQLSSLTIYIWKQSELELNSQNQCPEQLDREKLNTLLQSMFNSFDHQIYTRVFNCERISEDTLYSILKQIEPGTLEEIIIDVSWQKEGYDQKLKEIIETEQWKQAEQIYSYGVLPLKIDDVLHCRISLKTYDSIAPEDFLRVTEHVFNSASNTSCALYSKNKNVDIDAIIDFLHSKIDGSKITSFEPINARDEFCYEIVKSDEYVYLHGDEHEITIQNY